MFSWLGNLIVPSGFLLVVSHLFAILILVFMGWVGKKGGIKKLDVRTIFVKSHIEHHWRCSYVFLLQKARLKTNLPLISPKRIILINFLLALCWWNNN